MSTKVYKYGSLFQLESGETLDGIEIAYQTYGKLNKAKNNVIWICHALTANAKAADWWPGIVGENKLFDPEKYFIISANILGSCYGTTGPLSLNAKTGKPYLKDFPAITVRDVIYSLNLLRRHLGIYQIHTLIGGSVGGQQVLEWAIEQPELIDNLIVLASNAKTSPWNIALNQSQRLAIEADRSFQNQEIDGGKKGLSAARSIALLSYRNNQTYNQTQAEDDHQKTDDFKASSYQIYQGTKLVNRFNAYSYYTLTKMYDTHNVGRGRGGVELALNRIKAQTLLIALDSDILYPKNEVKAMQKDIQAAMYEEVESEYGHDGFLLESEKITNIVRRFYLLTSPDGDTKYRNNLNLSRNLIKQI
jgi:homoserine O-acetyltransferase/O-succinyltransferase